MDTLNGWLGLFLVFVILISVWVFTKGDED